LYLARAIAPSRRSDVNRDGGMTVTVGRLRSCPGSTTSSSRSGKNTSAARPARRFLNAELMQQEGML